MKRLTKLFNTKASSVDEQTKTIRFKISDNKPDRMDEILIGRLAVAKANLVAAEELLNQLALQAREAGAPWTDIARAVDITPQTAHQRWSEGGREKHRERMRRTRRESA